MDGHREFANPIRRLGIGWLEWLILGVAILGIASAIISIRITSSELNRQSNRALIGAEMRHAITSSQLWFVDAWFGETDVDVATDVFGNIDYADSLGRLLLSGGESATATIDAIQDDQLRASLIEILDELAVYRELSEVRWAEREPGVASTVTSGDIDASYTRIMDLFVEAQGRFTELENAGEQRIRFIGVSLIVFQLLLVAGIAIASNRSRARIQAQNTTLQHQADALRESQRRVEDAQQLARLGYIEWELASNASWWWSDEVYRIYGFEPGEIDPTPELMRQMIHHDDLASVEHSIGEAVRSRASQPLAFRIVREDGELRSLKGRMLAVAVNGSRPTRLVGTLQDVTDQKRAEDELRRSRASLSAGQQIAGLGTWDLDLKTMKAWWSESVYRIVGVEQGDAEASFDQFLEAVHPDDRQIVLNAMDTIATTGEPVRFEVRLPQQDGTVSTIQVASEAYQDDDGRPARLIGALQDITERKQIEDELRRNRASLEAGQQVAELGTWELAFDKDSLWWSDEVYRIFGYEPDAFVPTFEWFAQAIHPDDRDAILATIDRTLANGEPYNAEMRMVRSDGSVRVIHARGEMISDDQGAPARIYGAVQDITERKRVEEELLRRRETLSAGQSLAHLGTWVWDLEDKRSWLSDETYRVMGLDPDSPLRTPSDFMSVFPPEERARIMQTIQAAVDERRTYDTELRYRLPDGDLRVAHVRGEAVYDDDGKPLRVLGAIQDITERKRIEEELAVARDQALEASRLKSEFLATMSHEIRTPMNGVLGMLDLLLDTSLSSQQKDFALSARGSAISLLTIINDVLDFSRVESGKLRVDRTDFDLTTTVERSAEILAGPARERNNVLMTYIDPAIPGLLRGDPGRIRQVLVNLIGNAVKFTEGGEVTVRALLDDARDGEASVRFLVSDTGIGISEDVRESLFEPFVQADASTTRRYGGTGLGLAIVRRLIELMGGTIDVESEVGKGSTFWFTVPFDVVESPASVTRPAAPRDVSDLRVMVVDPLPDSREIMRSYIDSWGMRNSSVSSAGEAFDIIRQAAAKGDPYNVAVISEELPDTGSAELARQIRATTALSGTHLILLTTYGHLTMSEQALDDGFSAYLTRPIRKSQLFDTLIDAVAMPEGDARNQSPPETATGVSDASARRPAGGDVILLAEDNPVNQKVARMQLERLGYRVEVVGDGLQAVEAMSSPDRYSLVFMDVQMPEMDGFAATRAIRKAEVASGGRTPIIAMTANALDGDREECLAAGMDDYLSKPVSRNKLREALERWLPASSQEVRSESN